MSQTKCSRCRSQPPTPGCGTYCIRCWRYQKARYATDKYREQHRAEVKRASAQRRSAEEVAAPPPPRSDVGWTSHFRDGLGARAGDGYHPLGECQHYGRCLVAYKGGGQAHCPVACPRWEAAQPAPATAYTSMNGAARGLPVIRAGRAA